LLEENPSLRLACSDKLRLVIFSNRRETRSPVAHLGGVKIE
jgi:hypothetical protein